MNENIKYKILLIVPAYNEGKNILNTYNKIIEYNNKYSSNYDVIVINDGSKDNTEEICQENKIPHVRLCNNSGIGIAVQTGYLYAKRNNYDIAIQYDGDGQHDVSYIKKIVEPIINNKANLVIGSRFLDTKSSEFQSSRSRRIGIKLISFFIKLLTGKTIFDTTSGFRACDKEIINKFSTNYPSEYPEPVSELQVLKSNYNIAEVPVSMNERTEGSSSISAWKSVYYMLNVIFLLVVESLGGNHNEH